MDPFIIPYVMLEDTKKAVAFYMEALGGEVRYTMLGKDTPNCPKGQEENVMHLEYTVHGAVIYFADQPLEDHHRIELHLNYGADDDIDEAFNKMKQSALEVHELKTEFWGARFGRIIDQFGVAWQFHQRAKKKE